MPYYEKDKSEIFKGAFMVKDGGPCIAAPRPKPPPVRYGDTFAEINQRQADIRERLDALVKEIRNARRH